jgi:hypothetical protein
VDHPLEAQPRASIEQRSLTAEARRGHRLPVLVPAAGYGGPDAPTNPGAVTVHQDAAMYATLLLPAQAADHRFGLTSRATSSLSTGPLTSPRTATPGSSTRAAPPRSQAKLRSPSGRATMAQSCCWSRPARPIDSLQPCTVATQTIPWSPEVERANHNTQPRPIQRQAPRAEREH